MNAAEAVTAPVRRSRSRWVRLARTIVRQLRRAVRHEVHAYYRRRRIQSDVVFYESFAGNGMLCNPEAIFRALLADPEFSHLRHVWALRSKHENRNVVREFAHDRRVRFVRTGSVGYFRALARSGWLVNNATFPTEFSKRPGQTYLNTWHGTPLKKMGYDINDRASRVANVVRNFLQADYLVAANPFMIEQMYERAHRLDNIFGGRIIDEGYPRIDLQFVDEAAREADRARVAEALGVDLGGRKIILYAPTWKGTNFNRPEDDIDELLERVTELRRGIDESRYVVVLKSHQVVHRFAAERPGLSGVLIPNELPTNALLAVTDVLVTDYSSIFFDFLATGRPIAFLTPDIDDYAGYRGLYFEPDEWPGPVVRSVAELVDALRDIDANGVGEAVAARYRSMQERFVSREDGGATSRIIDIVFRGRTEGYRVVDATRDGRTTLLISAGGMRPNGITSSLINLLNALDYRRFDVTVMFPNSYRPVVVAKQGELNPHARQLARVGGMNGSKLTHLRRRISWWSRNLVSHRTSQTQRRLWDDEWQRCFGSARFDEVIDFSGYGPFFSTLVLHAPDAERSIWLHNDMMADAYRVTRGRRRHLRDLRGIFSLYRDFDHLVSVSASLNDINRARLAMWANPSRFTSARNLIDPQRVRHDAAIPLASTLADPETGEAPAWASRLARQSARKTFVTVGRISPEKNHARLLDAFAKVHAVHPESQLVIVGSGPLLGALEHRAAVLGISDAVIFAGHQSNPHAIMAASDCFVLSSDYEGQPMVLLEALMVGLPIVTVAFGAVADAVPEGSALVVLQDVDGLADGMTAFLEGRVAAVPLDAEAYNREAITEFSRAIGAPAPAAIGAAG
jgi:CDP-glycerol glycerophosphotransferase (TagB/SpsB family)/glycosyltransferase involved in cell wall biosynthesis